MKTIRASEIGTYLYCQRAWWYQKQGYESENQVELLSGQDLHARHGRNLFVAGCLKVIAYGLLLAALVLIAAYVTYIFL